MVFAVGTQALWACLGQALGIVQLLMQLRLRCYGNHISGCGMGPVHGACSAPDLGDKGASVTFAHDLSWEFLCRPARLFKALTMATAAGSWQLFGGVSLAQREPSPLDRLLSCSSRLSSAHWAGSPRAFRTAWEAPRITSPGVGHIGTGSHSGKASPS